MKKIAAILLMAIVPASASANAYQVTHSSPASSPDTDPHVGITACIVWGLSNADYHGAVFLCDVYDGPLEGTPNWDRWNHRR
ncbi:MAG: hypothetical protein R3E14_07420 [Erythrobacter sp.]